MRYFDYETVAREAGIPPAALEALRALVRRDFPDDDMMFELYLLRSCKAIGDGHVTLEAALAPQEDASARR